MAKTFLMVFSFCLAVMLILSAKSQASTIHVPDDYKNIQAAVDAAIPGDTIIVASGEYSENLVVTKPVIIKSKNGHDTSTVKALLPSAPVFKVINTDTVVISGFTAAGSANSGIYLYRAGKCEISNNKTVRNGSGIVLSLSDNNHLINNEIASNEKFGIYLESSGANTIDKNTVSLNNDKGIFFNLSDNNTLSENVVSSNYWDGITLWSSNYNTLDGNKVLRNMYGITISNSSGNILINNSVWRDIYVLLPVILIYMGIMLYVVERKIFRIIYFKE